MSSFHYLETLVRAFLVLGKWVVWKIGRAYRLILGEDPWVGFKGNFRLIVEVKVDLQFQGLSRLVDKEIQGDSRGWHQSWKSVNDLNL